MSSNLSEMFRAVQRPWDIPIYWDPVPPWLELNKDLLRRFIDLEIQFKIREAQLQQEKLEQFRQQIIGQ